LSLLKLTNADLLKIVLSLAMEQNKLECLFFHAKCILFSELTNIDPIKLVLSLTIDENKLECLFSPCNTRVVFQAKKDSCDINFFPIDNRPKSARLFVPGLQA
jgi:hypothetical protein